MKTTKKIILPLFAILAIVGFSCEENLPIPLENEAAIESFFDDDVTTQDWEEVSSTDLASVILDYINANYDGQSIKKSWVTDEGEFMVALNKALILVFDAEGVFVEEFDAREHRGDRDPIALADIPQAILDFVNTNYPTEQLEKAFVNDKGEYILKFDDCLALIFDAQGNFIEEVQSEDRRKKDHRELSEADLPAAALDYLAQNYSDEIIDEVYFNERRQLFIVELENDVVLIFDIEGNFVDRRSDDDNDDDDDDRGYGDDDDDDGRGHGDRDHDRDHGNEIDPSQLPQAVLEYLATNYPNDRIDEVYYHAEKETYKVELESDTYVFFDAQGNFIRAVKEDEQDSRKGNRDDRQAVATADLPQAILDYLSNNYPNDPVDEAYYNTKREIYVVELESDLKVVFDKGGNFVKTI